jgi:hypothetical protein
VLQRGRIQGDEGMCVHGWHIPASAGLLGVRPMGITVDRWFTISLEDDEDVDFQASRSQVTEF